MRIVFMGTPEFAVPAMLRLLDSKHQIILAVTQPDRPKGRGLRLEASPVKELAEARGIPVITPKSVRKDDTAAVIAELAPDAIVVAAFGQILPQSILEAAPHGCLNIHPSLLPEWRGAAPIQRCLLAGERETGVTIMQLERELDSGPIVAQQKIDILPDDDARSLAEMCSVLGADMLLRVLDEAEQTGQVESVAQDHALATYAPPIKKEEGLVPWAESAEKIMFRLRAFTPAPGVFTFINGMRRINIVQAEPRTEDAPDGPGFIPPGTIIALEKGRGFLVQAADGPMLVTRVKPEGKGEMDADAFGLGRGIKTGDILGAPKS